jgi:transcriptional antiterminator RfaH
MAQQWYALRSTPRKEEVVWKQAHERGFEVFFPRIRVHPVNPRSKKLKPYFPGYLFIRLDLSNSDNSAIQWMPHTVGLVSFGEEPAAVPDHLIQAIQHRIEEIAAAGGEVFDGLKQGDVVRIEHGPFEGYEGIFDARLPGSERVRVLLQLINDRKVPVELNTADITARYKQ